MSGKSPTLFTTLPEIKRSFSKDSSIVLHCGDTLSFLKTLPENTAKLIISSPPYNIGKEYENRKSLQSYFADQEPVIDELVRILREDGSLCWEVGNYVIDSEIVPLDIVYYDLFKNRGLKLRNRIICSRFINPLAGIPVIARLISVIPRDDLITVISFWNHRNHRLRYL
jgi:DNA modification methylase